MEIPSFPPGKRQRIFAIGKTLQDRAPLLKLEFIGQSRDKILKGEKSANTLRKYATVNNARSASHKGFIDPHSRQFLLFYLHRALTIIYEMGTL